MIQLASKLAEDERLIRIDYADLKTEFVSNQLNHSPDRIILIENFPNSDSILNELVIKLGVPIFEPRNNRAEYIFEVKVEKEGSDYKSYANSNYFFPLHSDCAEFEKIPNCVALHCITASKVGGENLFVNLSQVIPSIPEEMLDVLLKKLWSFGKQKKSILRNEGLNYSICYNRIIMESYFSLTQEEIDFLNKFDELCSNHLFQIKLKPGDLILFRNDKILHGRNEFPKNTDRFLKRIRFQVIEK